MSAHPSPTPRPRPRPVKVAPWTRRVALPIPTLVAFGVLALLLWVNAAVNQFRFNVAIAVLATVPVLVLVARSAAKARQTDAVR